MLSISSFINPEVSYAIFQSLLHSLWQIPLLALGLKLITRYKSKPSVQMAYHANLSAIIMSMIAAGFTFSYYLARGIKAAEVLESGVTSISNSSSEFFAIVEGAQPASLSWSEWLIQYNGVIVLIWIIGATLFLSRIIAGWIGLHFLKRDLQFQIPAELSASFQKIVQQLHIKKPVRLALSSIATVPMIIGHVKPIVLLPIATINHLSQEEVESILVHELAHILHYDFIKNLIVMLGESIFFYHPVIWLLSSEIKEERENLCDDTVVKMYPNRIQYAKTLVKLGDIYQKQNNNLSLALFNNKFKLMKRIKRILNISNESKFGNTKIVVLGLLLCSVVVFSSADVFQKIKEQNTIENVASIDNLTFGKFDTPVDYSIPKLSEITSKKIDIEDAINNFTTRRSDDVDHVLDRVTNFSNKVPEAVASLIGNTFSILPTPSVEPLVYSFDRDAVFTIQDTITPEERARLKAEMKAKKEELKAQYKEQHEKMKASREKIKAEYKEKLKKKKEELKKVREKLGEDGNSFQFHFDGDMTDEEAKAWAAEMAEWGEHWGEQFAEQFDEEWVQDMEAWGERFGEEFSQHFDEDWVHDMELWGEEFGEKMGNWGEEFGEKFGEEFDNEWTHKFEHLGEQMENTFTEEWLEDVAKIGEKVALAVERAMQGIDSKDFNYDYSYGHTKNESGLKAHLVENLNEQGLLTDKDNTIIITDDKMTVNGKTLSNQQLNAFKELVKKYSQGAFKDGKTKVKFKIQGKDLDTSKRTGLTVDINDR